MNAADRLLGSIGASLGLRDAGFASAAPGAPLRPHTAGRRWAFSHYNVVLPTLPDPWRSLGTCVIAGRPGVRVFDLDHVGGRPRGTATVAVGTAAGDHGGLGVHRAPDVRLDADGSCLSLGEELRIAGALPAYEVTIRRPDLEVRLDVRCTGQRVWFARSAVYEHLALPAHARGELVAGGERYAISGAMSLEHARGAGLTALVDRTVPQWLKLPWDAFTYQVLEVVPGTLLMLVDTGALGRTLLTAAYLTELGGRQWRAVRGVVFEVLAHHDEPLVGPDDARTRLPAAFRWRVPDEEGGARVEIEGHVDRTAAWSYGLGRGWIGTCRYEGRVEGEPVAGEGYVEWARPR